MYIIYKHNIYTHIHIYIYIYIYTHTMATMAGGICHGNFVSRLVLSINSARLWMNVLQCNCFQRIFH